MIFIDFLLVGSLSEPQKGLLEECAISGQIEIVLVNQLLLKVFLRFAFF